MLRVQPVHHVPIAIGNQVESRGRKNEGIIGWLTLTNSKALAGGGGFEPPSATPKAAVLPLDDPPENNKKRRLA